VSCNKPRWAKQPDEFAKWCIKFLLGDPRESFSKFWDDGECGLKTRGDWIWSKLLYLRRSEGFHVYMAEFGTGLAALDGGENKLQPKPSWEQYLSYCQRVRDVCVNFGVADPFADLVFSIVC